MNTGMIAPLVEGFLLAILVACIACLIYMVHAIKRYEREKQEKAERIAQKKANKAKANGRVVEDVAEKTIPVPEKIVTEDGKKLTLAQREALRRQKK